MRAAGEPQTLPSGPIYVPLRRPGGWRGFLPRRPATCRPYLHGQVPQTGLKTAPGFTLTVTLSALLTGWLLLSPRGHLCPRSGGRGHTPMPRRVQSMSRDDNLCSGDMQAAGTCAPRGRIHGQAPSKCPGARTCTQETSPRECRAFPRGAGIGGGKLFPFLLPEASAAKRDELIYCCPPRWRPGRRPFACCAAELKAEVRARQVAEDDTPAPLCHLRTTRSPLWLHSPRCGLGASGPPQRGRRPSATGD